MNEAIINFLQEQTCATLCCTDVDGQPYCFSCYYVFDKEIELLYFKSSADAHHSVLLNKKPELAGTVLPDKLNKLMIRGIQLQGEVLPHLHPWAKDASARYHKKYPMALAVKGDVYTVMLKAIKMTGSKLGFARKINWKRAEQPEKVNDL